MLGQYNNYCGVNNYYDSNAWNFGVWDDWAKNTSPNKNIKIFVGAPAAESAANTGYVNAETLGKIAQETRSKYSSFGGIMLWDISQAYGNNRYDIAVKNALAGDHGNPIIKTTSTKTRTSTVNKMTSTKTRISTVNKRTSTTKKNTFTSTPMTQTTQTTTPTITSTIIPTSAPEGCKGIANWDPSATYVFGNVVSHDGHKWTAKWWSFGDTPGGVVGVWNDNGPCSTPAKQKKRSRFFKF
ncbi:hypothetical protein H2248_008269 [Termitomyces sp. 'cryptogamus']|nr:hypothetical protein H2248_008269 [Termitomyces sp. 'cryptogamus']